MKKELLLVFMPVLMTYCAKKNNGTTSIEETAYPSELAPAEYMAWSKSEAKLTNTTEFSDMSFRLTYHPSEWMAMQELGKGASVEAINQEKENYSELFYFTLRVAQKNSQTELLKAGKPGSEEYQKRVNYYSFAVQKDIYLVSGKDTLTCGMAHFERAFNITNYSDIMIGFSRNELEKLSPGWDKISILFEDKVFGHGKLFFPFDRKQLTNTPKLKVS